MTRSAAPSALTDRQVEVETPEHVAIGYDLADLGSRFAALLIDGFLVVCGMLVLAVGLPLLLFAFGAPGWFASVGWAVVTLLLFAWTWGYFVYFEGLRDGQTPGKRRMSLRVVHDGGYPVTVRGAAVRNLLRLVDMQPGVTWLAGGAAMMLHPRTKRLGDMAAGTVVVRERTGTLLPEEAAAARTAAGPPRLTAAEWDTLAKYVARREGLQPGVRHGIAGRLMERLERHAADDPRRLHMSPDVYLGVMHAEESLRRAGTGGGATGSPQAAALVRRQRRDWDEYRALLERARKRGLDALPEREVSRFAGLYREVAADLARARTYGGSGELIYTLERSVGSGHNLLYRPARRSWRRLREWLTVGFPALVRLRWRPIALAAAFLYVPGLIAFTVVRLDPPRAREIVSAEMLSRAENAAREEAEGKGYAQTEEVLMPVMASGIIANNVQVTFVAFAGGILAGLGTVAALVFNGVHLGSAAGVFANEGQSMHLWSFVLPHGVIELTAICIAGGAGLWLASGILLPGRRTRREALVVRGREAISLLGGTVMLLLVAGTIEGFVSPSPIPRPVKLAFAAVIALLLVAYLGVAGRGEAAGRRSLEEAGR
ncbi:MAG: stage II sporulation protein M [Gemmatimonadetes bacterium]|nr:stage II sporulation protein M [Gemmatimonadota bacterium]